MMTKMMSRKTTHKRIFKEDADFLDQTFPKLNSAQKINLGISLLRNTDLVSIVNGVRKVEKIKRK